MSKETTFKPLSGYLMLTLIFIWIALNVFLIVHYDNPWFLLGILLGLFLCVGFFFIYLNGARVLTLFGEYKGTVKVHGLVWANPLFVRKNISLRARNFDSERLKVNDKLGN